MKRHIQCVIALGILAGMVASPGPVLAQSVYGGIQGIVRDSSGEPVSGAAVTALSVEKGGQRQARTDQQGHYEFPGLQPETYDLTVVASGGKVIVRDISVVADDEALVDAVLPKPGQIAEVTGPSGGTLKLRSDISLTLDQNAIQNLPDFDRNFTRFGLLATGAQLRFVVQNAGRNPQNSLLVSVNGQAPSGTALLLDGTDNRDPSGGGALINSPLESLAETTITTQSFDAETGQALSGVITAETRSGSNSWHGSAFDFRRSDWGEAHNPNLNNPSLAILAPFKINLFGGSLGGPILKNKLFVFGDYEGTRRSFGSTQVLNVPTQQVRDTCFTAIPGVSCNFTEYLMPYGTVIDDPITGLPFHAADCPTDGYCIPSDRLSPQAINLLKLLPAPNLGGVISNYSASGAEIYNDDNFDVRVDQNVSEKFKLFTRYSFSDYRIDSPSVFGAIGGGRGFSPDAFAGTTRSRVHSLSAGFDYSLNSSLITDFRFGFFNLDRQLFQNSYNTNAGSAAGIAGLNLGTPLTSGTPEILITQPTLGIASSAIQFGDGGETSRCTCPLLARGKHFQWVNNWADSHGNHLFKWGIDFRREQEQGLASTFTRAGILRFTTKDTAPKAPTLGGLGLATFLLGDVSSFSRTVSNIDADAVHQNRLFLYGQDTWRVTSKFSLSYGLRWEIYLPQSVSEKNGGGWLDLNTGIIKVAGYPCCNLKGNVQGTLSNFAPRLGIAYQLNKLTVVRAAYGRNFDAASPQIFGLTPVLTPPVLADQQVIPTSGNTVFNLTTGSVPAQPDILFPNVPANGKIPLEPGITVSTVPAHLQVPTLDQWNFTIQHEFTPQLYMELVYAGNKGTHEALQSPYNVNQPTIQGFAENNCFANPTSTPCLERFPYYTDPGWGPTSQLITQPILYSGDAGNAIYHALQAKVVKRFGQGYQFTANYTWSKGLSFNSDYFIHDPRLNYGLNSFDRTHTFNFYNVVNIPVGRNKTLLGGVSPLVDYFVGGWSLNTITTWASGLPFSPSYNPQECIQDRDTGPCRPNLVGPVEITGDRNNYFTTSTKPLSKAGVVGGPWERPATGTFGDAGFNSLRGPAYFNTDLSLTKEVTIAERYTIQFRTDFLNVFNKVNLANPGGCVDCIVNGMSSGGVITSLAPNASQRQIQLALRVQF